MTNNLDYRQYLESHFERLHESNARIEEELIKVSKRIDVNKDDIDELKLKSIEHIIECPVKPRVRDIEKDLEEYRFFKKYPKIFIGTISVLVLCVIVSFIATKNNIKAEVENTKASLTEEIRLMDGVSKVTRNGMVKYNDFGLTDSIKVR